MTEHICDGQWRYYCEACSGLPEAGEKPMTDQDNLRNRIADIIERVGNDWDAQMMSAVVDGKPEPPKPLADTAAQAIIDELGLTVEKSMVGHEVHDDGSWTTWPSQARVVGKWVKQ